MKSKSTREKQDVADKTDVMKWHSQAEKKARNFLFWQVMPELYDQLYARAGLQPHDAAL